MRLENLAASNIAMALDDSTQDFAGTGAVEKYNLYRFSLDNDDYAIKFLTPRNVCWHIKNAEFFRHLKVPFLPFKAVSFENCQSRFLSDHSNLPPTALIAPYLPMHDMGDEFWHEKNHKERLDFGRHEVLSYTTQLVTGGFADCNPCNVLLGETKQPPDIYFIDPACSVLGYHENTRYSRDDIKDNFMWITHHYFDRYANSDNHKNSTRTVEFRNSSQKSEYFFQNELMTSKGLYKELELPIRKLLRARSQIFGKLINNDKAFYNALGLD